MTFIAYTIIFLRKNVTIVEVSIPKNPIPVSIIIPAIILPIVVCGDISPYPTIEVVTKLHHSAFPNDIPSANCIPIATIINVDKVILY